MICGLQSLVTRRVRVMPSMPYDIGVDVRAPDNASQCEAIACERDT